MCDKIDVPEIPGLRDIARGERMPTPLLTTKVYIPPTRPDLVSRPRLVERLNAGLLGQSGDQGRLAFARKLTLISAPAGFGKTTLLSEWTGDLPSWIRVAWLSLDEGDNDPTRFWRYVIAALQTVDATVGETAQATMKSPQQPSLETLVTALMGDILAAFPSSREGRPCVVLVLDDYHVIQAKSIHDSLDLFLNNLPPQFHVVITTREDPPLSLPRRRGRRELVEIRAADLRFTKGETTELLSTVSGLDLPAEDIAALENRTEGWVVGLQLATLSLQELDHEDQHDFVIAFAGDDRYIVDYLVDEVFQRQPSHVQSFLLQTSILDRLCSALCDAVTGRDDGRAILDHLDRANIFVVPLDNRRHWYRYHHLFADLLRQRLSQSPLQMGERKGRASLAHGEGEGGTDALVLRASRWCESEGFAIEAVSYALAASDPTHAADLIERHVLDMFYRSETVLVHDWLKALPDDALRALPLLCAVYANTIVLTSPRSSDCIERAEQWLQEAEKALSLQSRAGKAPAPSDRAVYDADVTAGFVATFRAYLARFRGDDPQTVIDLSSQALERLPGSVLRFRSALAFNLGMAYLALGDADGADQAFAKARQVGKDSNDLWNALTAIFAQAQIAHRQGRLRKAAAICREALQSIAEPDERAGRPLPAAGAIYVILGSILLEWNDLDTADHALTRGLELTKPTAAAGIDALGYSTLARLRQIQGDVPGTLDLLERVARRAPELGSRAFAAALRVRLWLAQTQRDLSLLSRAARWAREVQPHFDDGKDIPAITDWWRHVRCLALVRLHIAQHRTRGRPGMEPVLHFLDRQLQVNEAGGWSEAVIEMLVLQALALDARGETEPAMGVLRRALALAEPEGYIRIFADEGRPMAALLRRAAASGVTPDYAAKLAAACDVAPTPGLKPETLIEPLSPRELEVIQLIATGTSNPEISRKLFISVNTVKKHITNIFGKLGVTSRTQAVARARQLRLVE
jgi:LuxR family maltose regulon positive regulatory protein